MRSAARALQRAGAGLAILAGSAIAAVSEGRPALEVTYLANEGVLLAAGDDRVIVDALFDEGFRGYERLPRATRLDLESGGASLGAPRLALATHEHRDHFDARVAARFLTARQEAVFVSTPQVVERLAVEEPEIPGFELRVHALWPAPGTTERLELGEGLAVEVARLSHGEGTDAQNLGFLVEIGGWTVLHVGDSEAGAEALAELGLAERHLDLALLPYWYLAVDERAPTVRKAIAPRRTFAFHLPVADAPRGWFAPADDLRGLLRAVEERFPEVVTMTEPLRRWRLDPEER